MNFDGYSDILYSVGLQGNLRPTYFLLLYNKKLDKFESCPHFEEWFNPEVDSKSKTIISYTGKGSTSWRYVLRFENDKLVLISEEEIEYIDSIDKLIRTRMVYDHKRITSKVVDTVNNH